MNFFHTKLVMSLSAVLLLSACGEPLDKDARLAALHLPPENFVGNKVEGAKLFSTSCSSCHGKEALGSQQGPPLIDPIYRKNHHADFAFHMAVRDGVRQHHWSFGDMPPVPAINPKQTAHVIAYIRSEQSKVGIK